MAELKNVEVGKYTLESLTTGMYSDPKIVYREYIQNSVDSLEEAVRQGLIEPQSMRIDVLVNEEENKITIRDNGVGISSKIAVSTLLNIGNSKKRNSTNRGFRGIGRLGGMSYCEKLIFITSSFGEKMKTIVSFDCNKLRKLLIPGEFENFNLNRVLEEITTINLEKEDEGRHYFSVEMEGVDGLSDLLDLDVVKSYISQVAPVTYSKKIFFHASELYGYFSNRGYDIEEFPIFVGDDYSTLEPIYKPNRYRFESDRTKHKADQIESIEYFDVEIDGELYALGWYANTNWYGTICDSEIAGIRVRKGNILIGDSKTLNQVFKEPRFNGWAQGELFIVTDKVIPNARRDDFEQNDAYYKLLNCLKNTIGTNLAKIAREASIKRNDTSTKVIKEVEDKVHEVKNLLTEGFNSAVEKEKVVNDLVETANKLTSTKIREDLTEKKDELVSVIAQTRQIVSESNNYKINKVNSSIDRKSKKILAVVSDILSEKLTKDVVDEIIDEIIATLNK